MTFLLFTVISLLSLLLFYFGTGRNKRLLFLFTAWQSVVGLAAFLSVFQANPMLFPLAILGTIPLVFGILKQVDRHQIDEKVVLAIHVLRIPVELILFQLYLQNKIPHLMTFKGWNFDILIGLSALVLLVYMLITNRKANRQLFIVWNVSGIVFLLFIVALAVLSSPLPIQQFAFDQPNIAVLEFPYCFLPTCVVPVVLMAHILLLRLDYMRNR